MEQKQKISPEDNVGGEAYENSSEGVQVKEAQGGSSGSGKAPKVEFPTLLSSIYAGRWDSENRAARGGSTRSDERGLAQPACSVQTSKD